MMKTKEVINAEMVKRLRAHFSFPDSVSDEEVLEATEGTVASAGIALRMLSEKINADLSPCIDAVCKRMQRVFQKLWGNR